jgi:predicted RNA-binding protein with PIN domain
MALLIDGYNLLNVTGIFGGAGPGTELHRTRLAFLNFLASSFNKRQRSSTTIVFDASSAPPGRPRSILHEGMTIHFAQQYSNADEMIEVLLEDWRAPKSLTVVSSDHRVQRAARRRGATIIDSEVWYADLCTRRRQREASANEASSKPAGSLSPDEVTHWLREFGQTPSASEDTDSPFPRGYGEDLIDE